MQAKVVAPPMDPRDHLTVQIGCIHQLFPQSGTENVLNPEKPEKPENPKNLYKFKKAPLREGPNLYTVSQS